MLSGGFLMLIGLGNKVVIARGPITPGKFLFQNIK